MDSGQNIAIFSENEPFRATKMWNELVKNFKSGVRLKKRRWRMKYYEDCFSGSDALAWVHDFLKLNPNFAHNVSRTQAKLLCQKLLQRSVFEDAVDQMKSTKTAFEESHLYRFVGKSGVAKEGRTGFSDAKENAIFKSKLATSSSLKRHSSFSERLKFTGKPLIERKALHNISNEVGNKNSKKQTHRIPLQNKTRRGTKNEKHGLVLQNLGSTDSNSVESDVHVSEKHSAKEVALRLSRKWKSEYDISLMEKDMEMHNEDNGVDMNCDTKETVLQGDETTNQPQMSNENTRTTAENCSDNCPPQADPNELWIQICLERLKHALNVDTLNGILDDHLISGGRNVMENITSELSCVTEAVPKWLVSAMKCLIHWPQSVASHGAGPDHSGFEKDIFKTIQEYFQLLPEPLVSSNFIHVFTKISGLITKCKLSAIRALQLTLLLLKKDQRQQLQLLLRFMMKISSNHQLNLSSHVPTRELVIQKFVPCIFGGKENRHVHEILGIRVTSFIMENYAEVFKVPDGLKFEVEQQIAFRKQKGITLSQEGRKTNGITYCLRVTKREYEEQKQLGTQRFLEDLLNNIVHDEKINEKERKKKLKQFQKTYPEIYYSRYPQDGLSVMSQQSVPSKLRHAIKPLTRRQMSDLR